MCVADERRSWRAARVLLASRSDRRAEALASTGTPRVGRRVTRSTLRRNSFGPFPTTDGGAPGSCLVRRRIGAFPFQRGFGVTTKIPPSLPPLVAALYISSARDGGRMNRPAVVALAT